MECSIIDKYFCQLVSANILSFSDSSLNYFQVILSCGHYNCWLKEMGFSFPKRGNYDNLKSFSLLKVQAIYLRI